MRGLVRLKSYSAGSFQTFSKHSTIFGSHHVQHSPKNSLRQYFKIVNNSSIHHFGILPKVTGSSGLGRPARSRAAISSAKSCRSPGKDIAASCAYLKAVLPHAHLRIGDLGREKTRPAMTRHTSSPSVRTWQKLGPKKRCTGRGRWRSSRRRGSAPRRGAAAERAARPPFHPGWATHGCQQPSLCSA